MFPITPCQYSLKLRPANFEFNPQTLLRSPGGSKFEDLFNLLFGQFRPAVSRANLAAIISSTLPVHIRHIVGLSSKEEVVGVEAGPVIAPVQHLEGTVQVKSEVEGSTQSVRSAIFSKRPEVSIPKFVEGTGKLPAPAYYFSLIQKSFFHVCNFSIIDEA